MMRHGITPSSTVQCPANLTVDTYTFGNYSASAGAPAAKLIYEIPAEANALIAEAALRSHCEILYSEDFQHGQRLSGRLLVQNPFLES